MKLPTICLACVDISFENVQSVLKSMFGFTICFRGGLIKSDGFYYRVNDAAVDFNFPFKLSQFEAILNTRIIF